MMGRKKKRIVRRTQVLFLAGLVGLAVTGGCSLFGPRDSGAHDSAPAWSPDGKTIAYVRSHDDRSLSGLYLIDENGRNNRLLLQGDFALSRPAWSPDGRWLAFTDFRDMQIYKIKVNGDSLTQLTSAGRNCSPTWSVADKIAFQSDLDHPGGYGFYAIWAMDSDGSSKRPLQPLGDPYYRGDGQVPSWSPDGSRLVFRRRLLELAVMDSAGQGQVRLHNDAFGLYSPAWSPDGRYIAICRDKLHDTHILLLDLQTMEQTRIPVKTLSLTWSPDGQKLCFTDCRPGPDPLPPEEPGPEGGRYLWIVRKDGTGLRRLTR